MEYPQQKRRQLCVNCTHRASHSLLATDEFTNFVITIDAGI